MLRAVGISSDPIDPGSFDYRILNMVGNISLAEVRETAEARSGNIYGSYRILQEILLRHELTIQRRWTGKTRQQRQQILLDHWPGMSATHRPDFQALRQAMWPYINQEDLLTPKALLLLLNARGRNPPPTFASADSDAMRLGVLSNRLSTRILGEHIMLLNGVRIAEEYGQLIALGDHPEAFSWMRSRKQFIPGEGLLVLEAQERLLRFLVDCSKQILSHIPFEDLIAPNFAIQPEPHLKTEQESSGFDSLAVMAREAPYRVPSELDLTRIELILGGRLAAAEDHVWTLREDPAYFVEQLIELKEHRAELVKDAWGNDHPLLEIPDQDVFWARVCISLICEAYASFELFAELHRRSRTLQRLHKKHADKISPTEDLPEELLSALLEFRNFLYYTMRCLLSSLRSQVMASTPWRPYFYRTPPLNPSSGQTLVKRNPSIRMSEFESNLFWLIWVLSEDGMDLYYLNLTLVIDELGRFLETELRAKDLITARMASLIGDLAITSQCIHQLNTYFPWARCYDWVLTDRQLGLNKELWESTKQWRIFLCGLDPNSDIQIAKLGNPCNQKFTYPFEKGRTKQNVEALRRAEQNLDAFWAAVDRIMYVRCGRLSNSALQRALDQPRIIRRTPEWVEPASSALKSGKEAVEQLYRPLSTIYIGEPAATNDPTTPSMPKQKTKTKSIIPGTNPPVAASPSSETTAPTLVSIPVDSRALKVFRTLFFNPAVTSSPGEVSWTDFLHAMTSTGLFAAEKLYGSCWQFQRLEGEQSRIQFHEPHPRGKIPFITARRHGRRLHRAFGWVGDTFCLKEK
ncbi:hypothetical protein O1611_g1719 [Lasiodiplodia mahajangana]|uniref:Uncharacterized protein n=1 Tax=Lasiodiplodia mahajangana TaxID=1108764 RepID=A0ACC2JWY0_9PEZI|nr:hypothetical protein O1611_g1719 [Lasiodiplodia mahajangana]